jgi:putative oxidoreductase
MYFQSIFSLISKRSTFMKAFLSLGRWLFAIPFGIFGLFHLMNADAMSAAVPAYMPAASLWIYLSGLGLLGACVSIIMGKYDKLATTALAVMLILFVALLHLNGAMAGGDGAHAAIASLLKDMSLAGAAMMYAQNYAKDNSIIG